MRAVNEGDHAVSTIVRATRPRLFRDPLGGRGITIGAGVTMAQIPAHRELAFLHPVARLDRRPGGAQHGDGRRQSLRRPPLTATSPRRCSRSTPRSRSQGGYGAPRGAARRVPARSRERSGGLVAAVAADRPREPGRLPLPQGLARQSRRASRSSRSPPTCRCPAAASRGARVAYGAHGADARSAPRRSSARSKGRRSTPPGSRRPLAVAAEGSDPPTDASPAPGTGARSSPCTCAVSC